MLKNQIIFILHSKEEEKINQGNFSRANHYCISDKMPRSLTCSICFVLVAIAFERQRSWLSSYNSVLSVRFTSVSSVCSMYSGAEDPALKKQTRNSVFRNKNPKAQIQSSVRYEFAHQDY